jgi:creatinine amidohydrolase
MRLQDLNWMDVERYLETDNRIILVTGSTEQHGYLSLLTDSLIPEKIALAVAEREKVLIAPPLNFGMSALFSEFPGTISLSRTTFDAIVSEIVESLLHQGFARFFIFNGHEVNKLPTRLNDLQIDGAATFKWFDWWRSNAMQAVESQLGLRFDHANWGENYPFTRVKEVPTGEKELVNPADLEAGVLLRNVLVDGSYGGPYQVDDQIMNGLFNGIVQEAADLIAAL